MSLLQQATNTYVEYQSVLKRLHDLCVSAGIISYNDRISNLNQFESYIESALGEVAKASLLRAAEKGICINTEEDLVAQMKADEQRGQGS